VKPVAEMFSTEKRRSDMLDTMRSLQKSPQSASKSISHLVNPANPASPHTLPIIPEDGQPLYTMAPYFEVKRSPKGGYGAFALQDIPPYTEILFEHALLQATNIDIMEQFDNLSAEGKEVFLRLASFDELDSNKVVAIFKTNR
jgi:hypothetical protein